MMISQREQRKRARFLMLQGNRKGFTIVELLVGMVVGAFVATFILGSYIHIAKMASKERQQAMMQVNQRGSIESLEDGVRMAGYDPEDCGGCFGVIDVRRYQVTNGSTAPTFHPAGSPALTVISDTFAPAPLHPDGVRDASDFYISYRLFDETGDGSTSLARDRVDGSRDWFDTCVTPRDVLADNIQAIAFAYAYDFDGDGQPDRTTGNENVIWAIDLDNDNVLDFNLDANDDGIIDLVDDSNGDNIIDAADHGGGGTLPTTPSLANIMSIRIFILAQADRLTKGFKNEDEYVVGNTIRSADNGDFNQELECLLMVRTIERRNGI